MYHFCTITNRTIISWGLFVYSNFLSTYLYSLLDCNLLMVYWLSLTSLWSHLELVHSRWSIDICKSINKWSEALLGCTQNQHVLKPLKKGHGDIDVNLLLIFVQRNKQKSVLLKKNSLQAFTFKSFGHGGFQRKRMEKDDFLLR